MKLRLLILVALAAAMLPTGGAWADPGREAAKVVAGYFYSAEAEDLEAHLATRDLAPGQVQKTGEFVQGIWARVSTREVKVGAVEVALSPDGGQALARCTVNAMVVNKETGESFAKQTTYVAVLVNRGGQWKVRRMLPETVFRRVQNEQMMARQTQRLLDSADRAAAPSASAQEAPRPSSQATLHNPAAPASPDTQAVAGAVPGSTARPGDMLDTVSRIEPTIAAKAPAQSPATAQPQAAPPKPASTGHGRVLRVERVMVFIDQGADQGVSPGQCYEVVTYKEITHPVSGKIIRLPRRVALIQVRQVWPKQARCLVLESSGSLSPGLSLAPVTASAR
ncbi:MAG: hypothetical protein K9K65_05285 [Desulfarculaceae bacterium]|nr:hypothetical protein [Desulfarculaceae bacterium]MCF8046988.1 hypothetical protein [Desulfarculaceae bacterium]MCF8063609.1 hypothetical protein [Desulfarculaceae bacterium]MCF8097236.1 hypothetical protein [Desulfarculaceae bacterium]